MTTGHIGYWAAVTIGLGCLVVVVSLVVIRFHADREEHRREALRTPLWRDVLTLSVGEPDEIEAATARLLGLSPAGRRSIERDVFALVPKLRGESRDRVRDVLRAWGSVEEARRSTASASPVRRARGYHRLGVLALAERRDDLVAGLDDRDFTARRTAMLALASFPEHDVVARMLTVATGDPRLRHDFLAAIDLMGGVAAPLLVERVRHPATDDPVRERWLAAEALGLVGEIEAVPALEFCLSQDDEELRIAALHSLAQVGLPTTIIAATAQLADRSPEVRRAAAAAAGMIGGRSALQVLRLALADQDVEVARAAASALRRSGERGLEVLQESDAPVAREALALSALRSA